MGNGSSARAGRDATSATTTLRAALPSLGAGEQRVIGVILAHRGEVAEWSTAMVAEASGTSPATVVRACQNAGFRGYQHVRLELARQADDDTSAGSQPDDDPVQATFQASIDALETARQTLDPVRFRAAAGRLRTASRIVLVGSGFSNPPIQDVVIRFLTAGFPVQAPTDVITQQFCAHALGDGDVCVAVSYSGANVHTLAACRTAKEHGAAVIAVTNFSRSPLVRLADECLVTGLIHRAHGVDPSASRVAQLVALQALFAWTTQEAAAPDDVGGMRDVVADALTEDPDD
jgi:DNA-binding MurR/RpiR family transcriptional regulator